MTKEFYSQSTAPDHRDKVCFEIGFQGDGVIHPVAEVYVDEGTLRIEFDANEEFDVDLDKYIDTLLECKRQLQSY